MTVNSQSTRQGERWFKQLALSGNSAQWQYVAVSISTGGSSSGSVLLKEHPEVCAYDDDGNLTSDGRWTYTWDAENRLRRMETASLAYTAQANRLRLRASRSGSGRYLLIFEPMSTGRSLTICPSACRPSLLRLGHRTG